MYRSNLYLPALGLFLPFEEPFDGFDEELNVEFDLIPPAWPDEEYDESPASDIPEWLIGGDMFWHYSHYLQLTMHFL